VKKDKPKEESLADKFNEYKKTLEFVFRQGVSTPVGGFPNNIVFILLIVLLF